ncbi:efflux transporter outer membrane subunit [Nibricoccus sp. IMCC34717]|uniref:efflux transporter outer membrane subunit n=1 Tax=Nibricoccus sp. IMCC34717 TaxID=3034021 RepID=UPI00384D4619
MRRQSPLLAAFVLFAGCAAVGPETRVETSAPAPAFTHPTEPTTATPSRSIEDWWRVFNDPALEALMAEALRASPNLQSAAARVAEARARLGISQADTQVSGNASGSARLAGESSERVLPVPGRPVRYRDSGDTYRIALDASYEWDLWGRVRRAVEGAAAGLRAAEADERGARLSLTADVAQAYFALRALDSEDAVLSGTLAQRRKSADLLASRARAGLGSELEVSRVLAEVAALDSERADLARRRGLFANALATLTGRVPSEMQAPTPGQLATAPQIPAGIPADVLRRRPDIALAEANLSARLAEIGVAEAARYPSVRLTAGAGLENADLANLLSRPSEFWQIGPAISVPLFTGGRTAKAIAVAKARAEQSRAEHRQRVLSAIREVEDALLELRQQAEQNAALERALAAATDAAKLAEVRQQRGFSGSLEVLDAERTKLGYERARVQLSGARTLSTIKLIRALGGAW